MTKLNRGSVVFALVFAWKIALFLLSAQPVPANDSFFYDGPVVNRILNGRYCNPSIAIAFPISGTEVYSCYPPLHQLGLLGWMLLFGTSVQAAIAFHLVLFGIYMLLLLGILNRLRAPPWSVAIAGGFVLVLTFHDRPDSLAHVLGMLGVYAMIRSRRLFSYPGEKAPSRAWAWLMAASMVLTLCTSLQIGATYFGLIVLALGGMFWMQPEPLPLAPLAFAALAPVALVAMVKFGFPHLWQGFQEHARQTPSVTGLRVPYLSEIIKIVRAVPGVFLAALLALVLWSRRSQFTVPLARAGLAILISTVVIALGIVVLSSLLLTANTIAIATYLQPLAAAVCLALCAQMLSGRYLLKTAVICFVAGFLINSTRAIGMSTWGLACARDVSCGTAIHCVSDELNRQPQGSLVVLSSAYLYEAARHRNVRWIHSDWLMPASRIPADELDMQGLTVRRPNELILTQFDYYRRFQLVLERLKSDPRLVDMHIENTAHVRAPDSYKSLQRVVQHISWPPVIVTLNWKQ